MENRERLKEIIKLARELGWLNPNPTGYPLMQLSEVEKCMFAMYDDYELDVMRKWVEQKAKEDFVSQGLGEK